jgi:predicted aspartyl protease
VEIGVPAGIVALLEKEGKPIPPPAIGAALIDTGAAGCVIDSAAAESLGLMPVDMVEILGVSAPERRPTYAVRFSFPELGGVIYEPETAISSGHLLQKQGLIALIGRDLLQHTVLVYNGKLGTITLAW